MSKAKIALEAVREVAGAGKTVSRGLVSKRGLAVGGAVAVTAVGAGVFAKMAGDGVGTAVEKTSDAVLKVGVGAALAFLVFKAATD